MAFTSRNRLWVDESAPDFSDHVDEPRLRQQLRHRIDYLLGRPLRTRHVLMELMELQEHARAQVQNNLRLWF